MSGHSKWSTIKRQKGAKDAVRGNLFTKLGNTIAVAARSGTDPETNFALRLAMDKAKAANMPMSNVQRAIDRHKDKNSAELQEVIYEGYGPSRAAIIVETLSENINRTLPNVKLAFSKHGGSLADKGSVLFLFNHLGSIKLKNSLEEVFDYAASAGALDVIEDEDSCIVYTNPKELNKVRLSLQEKGLNIESAELIYHPKETTVISDEATAGKLIRLLDALEDIDDVINTYVNFDISQDLLESMES